jgi:hypothetical protein
VILSLVYLNLRRNKMIGWLLLYILFFPLELE